MPQLFIWGLSISKAPLQASTSSSWARSGKPSRTRNRSSFHGPRRIFILPARHCELNGPNLVSLSTTLWSRRYGEGTERAHQVKRLALAGLPRILAEPDADPFAVLRGGIEQQSVDVARVGPPAHHIQEPEAAVLIAAELDANGPIGVVELGLFGRGEIPITDNFEIRRDFVDDRTPLFFEIEPGSRPDLPIATQQPLSLEQRQRQQPGEIFRVDPHQSRVVEHRRRDECDADRRWRVDARRKILQPRQVLHQVIGPIGPNDLFRDADEIAQNAGTLGDRKPALRVNQPRQEVGNPTVRVRVARRADIGPDAAGRAVAADHVEELMRREMRQFVETDQRNLSALPVVNGGFKLQVRKLDLAGARPAPLAHTEVRGPADPRIEV